VLFHRFSAFNCKGNAMSYRQIGALMSLNFTTYFAANALLPLLPGYARTLGMNVTLIGLYLGVAFAALTLGSLASGWIASRLNNRHRMLMLLSGGQLAALLLLNAASTVGQLVFLTALIWFAGGVITSTITVLAGALAGVTHRGRTFGVIAFAAGLSQIAAGISAGFVVERWGYAALFLFVASTKVMDISIVFIPQELPQPLPAAQVSSKLSLRNRSFWLLVASSISAYVVLFSANLARPIAMAELGFTPSAISGTVAVAGLLSLSLPFLIGWLSDQIGRRTLLAFIYSTTALGAGFLAFASTIEHFWLSTALIAMLNASMPLVFALAADELSPASLNAGLARLTAAPWVAGVMGYAGGGLVLHLVGIQMAFVSLAALPLLAAFFILTSRHRQVLRVPPHLRTTSTHAVVSSG
jgi:MFS family permease